jgi:hypothetical protein
MDVSATKHTLAATTVSKSELHSARVLIFEHRLDKRQRFFLCGNNQTYDPIR